MRKKIIIAGIILILLALVATFTLKGKGNKPISVKTASVQKNNLATKVYTSGQFAAGEEQKAYVKVNGIIAEIKVKPGDKVKKGDLLLAFETTDIVKAIREAEASLKVQLANLNKEKIGQGSAEIGQAAARVKQSSIELESAKRKLARYQALYATDALSKELLEQAEDDYQQKTAALVISQKQLEGVSKPKSPEVIAALEAQVTQASINLDNLREQLKNTQIRSEIDGIVLTIEGEKGKFVPQGSLILTVGNLDSLRVLADVSEGDSSNLQLGQTAEITSSSAIGEKLNGSISKLSPIAVSKTKDQGQQRNIVPVEITTKANAKFRPGVSADIDIITNQRTNVLTIPLEALKEEQDKKYVFIIDKEKAIKKLVTTGLSNELYIEVVSGLNEGQKVVINPPKELKDKSQVKGESH